MQDPLTAFRLDGRAAAVTGGASGIGQATAKVLAAAGATVVVGDVDEGGCEKTAAEIADAGGRAIPKRCDVTRKADLDALVDAATSEAGSLDVMCNVAGIASDALLADASEDEIDRVIGVNLKGVLFGCQAAMRVMGPQGSGSIINVSSSGIDAPAKGYGVYAMTKAAVAMLTKTLAVEAGPSGVRVNAIAPGATVTAFTERHLYDDEGNLDESKYEAFLGYMRKQSPLGLVGEPEDQAYLALYLASDAARFSTGAIWRANGGQTFSW